MYQVYLKYVIVFSLTVLETQSSAFESSLETLSTSFKNSLEALSSAFESSLETLSSAFESFLETLSSAFGSSLETLSSAFESSLEALPLHSKVCKFSRALFSDNEAVMLTHFRSMFHFYSP